MHSRTIRAVEDLYYARSDTIWQFAAFQPSQPTLAYHTALYPKDTAIAQISFQEAVKEHVQEIAGMNRNRPGYCNFIVAHLSQFSLHQCRDKDAFKNALTDNYPLALFQAISTVHLMSANAPNVAVQLSNLLGTFYTIRISCDRMPRISG